MVKYPPFLIVKKIKSSLIQIEILKSAIKKATSKLFYVF